MTTTTLDSVEPEQTQGGFLSRMFNKIVAPVKEWVNDLQESVKDAIGFEKTQDDYTESCRVDNINMVMEWVNNEVENPTPENIRAYVENVIKNNDNEQSTFFDYGDITADEIMEKIAGQPTPRNDCTLEA